MNTGVTEEQALEVYKLIERAEYNKVIPLLDQFDVNGNYFEEYGTFLNLAVSSSNKEAVLFLLENGANVNKMLEGNNVLIYSKPVGKKDIEILQVLLEAGAWILPFYPSNKTVLQNLETLEYKTEENLEELEYQLSMVQGNNRYEEEDARLSSSIVYEQEVLEAVRKEIEMIRPIVAQNVRALKIKFSGSDREEEIQFDIRAPVAIFVNHIFNFFLGGIGDLDLVVPSFHLKNKKVMNKGRSVSDYGLRDGSVVVVVPKVASARHWEGGKRKTRKQRRHR